jgi:hypothetical protein
VLVSNSVIWASRDKWALWRRSRTPVRTKFSMSLPWLMFSMSSR